jgi:hypothetical protein
MRFYHAFSTVIFAASLYLTVWAQERPNPTKSQVQTKGSRPPTISAQATKPKVYVAPFTARRAVALEVLNSFTDEFETALIYTSCYDVLQRRDLDQLLKQIRNEKALTTIRDLGLPATAELRGRGATAVIFGEVDDDVGSGEVVVSVQMENFDSTIPWKKTESLKRGLQNDRTSRRELVKRLITDVCATTPNSDARRDATSPAGQANPTLNVRSPEWSLPARVVDSVDRDFQIQFRPSRHAVGLSKCRNAGAVIACLLSLTRLADGNLDYRYDPRDPNFASKLIDNFKVDHKQMGGYFLNGRSRHQQSVNLTKDETTWFVQEFEGATNDIKEVRIVFPENGYVRGIELRGAVE